VDSSAGWGNRGRASCPPFPHCDRPTCPQPGRLRSEKGDRPLRRPEGRSRPSGRGGAFYGQEVVRDGRELGEGVGIEEDGRDPATTPKNEGFTSADVLEDGRADLAGQRDTVTGHGVHADSAASRLSTWGAGGLHVSLSGPASSLSGHGLPSAYEAATNARLPQR